MKIIVAGPREKFISDIRAAKHDIIMRLQDLDTADTTIVQGESPGGGIDLYAKFVALNLGLHVIGCPITDEDRQRAQAMSRPKFAPIARTIRMFDEHPDTKLVIAWANGNTPGTRFTIEEARRRGIEVEVRPL